MRWVQFDNDDSMTMMIWWRQFDGDDDLTMTIQWRWQFDNDSDDLRSSICFTSQVLLLPLTTLTESTIQQDWWLQLTRQVQWNDQ